MRVAVGQMQELSEETLLFAGQLGVSGIQMNTPNLPGQHRWEYTDLAGLQERCKQYGLKLEALENVPIHFYDKAILGLPGRDEQIEHYQATIRNMGRAGIPILGHHFMPNFVWRTSFSTPGRAGAKVSSFDLSLVEPNMPRSSKGNDVATLNPDVKRVIENSPDEVIGEEQMWSNYEYFIKAIIPVAEQSGVKLALHPDDPPVEMLGGIARLFRNKANFIKAMKIANSEAWGLDLCLGCCSEMPGGERDALEMVEHFGPLGRIFYVHFRDVQGTVPKFQECFLGEGNYNPARMMKLLKKTGFNGFILDDHVPAIVNDSPWGHRSRGHAIGYMQGLIDSIDSE